MKKPLLHHLHDYFLPHERNGHKPHLFSGASVAALVVVVVLLEGAYLLDTKFIFLRTDFLASVLPSALAALTNQDRAAQGVPAVTEDPVLDAAAQAAANDMAAKGYFAHISPDGKDPWYWLDQAGYRYSYAGQNLAVNFTDSSNVETAWMDSPTHRANIVKPEYTQVGFGTANGTYDGQETTFVVEYFAAPAPVKVASAAPVVTVPKPRVAEAVATTGVQVLGTETNKPAPAAPAPANGFVQLLTSPYFIVTGLLMALLAIIAVSWSSTIFVRGKVIHPHVVLSGVFLVLLISGAMFASSMLGGTTNVIAADGQGAVAIMAVR